MNEGLTNAQQLELTELIAQAMAIGQIHRPNKNGGKNKGDNNDSDDEDVKGTSIKSNTSAMVTSSNWRADEVGLFDLQLDISHGEGEIVTVGKDVYY